ncbi:MAG: response regulator transcription factor [Ruminococcaceae bacterium]|nr:response regulator transcription factor [Oscillospiraceae bacterium]
MYIAIAEDDPQCIRMLQDYLRRFGEKEGIALRVCAFSSGPELLDAYNPQWDLILLDIEMPLMDGLTVAKHIRRKDDRVMLMFITKMAQFAINGYEVAALDYVLKPVSYPMFHAKMKRVYAIWQVQRCRSVVISCNGSARKLSLDQLYYIEVFSHTLTYHTVEGSFSATGSRTIRQLEQQLAADSFFRCNQCYLINLKFVESIDGDRIHMTNGKKLSVSRGRRKEFLHALMRYWGG